MERNPWIEDGGFPVREGILETLQFTIYCTLYLQQMPF
jgi:hypothetical protein